MKLVELAGLHIEATTGAPIVLLRETDAPHRVLPIFVGGLEATAIALALNGHTPPRPLTHDVMAALVEHLDAHVDAVEVTDLHDGAYLAHLNLSGPTGHQQVDSRPSDAIALAVRVGAPVFVSEAVLDEAGTVLPDDAAEALASPAPMTEASIEAELAEFRSFLDDLDAGDFETGSATDG